MRRRIYGQFLIVPAPRKSDVWLWNMESASLRDASPASKIQLCFELVHTHGTDPVT